MEIIRHRRNTSYELADTPHQYGVEFDLRSKGSRLILHHDPFVDGEEFGAWLQEYRHGTLIVNVKEEGLEQAALDILRAHSVERFFFLDQSFPFLIKTARAGERRCAVRVSEYESIDTALALSGLVDWIWVDCFARFPLSKSDADRLHNAGFKLCLVSPELQGRNAEQEIPEMKRLMKRLDIAIEAVCTKAPDLWR